MNSRGFSNCCAALRGRTWSKEEAIFLKQLVDIGTSQTINKMKPTHILVTPCQSDINLLREVIHFYSVNEVKSYIELHPEVLHSTGYSFYKVDKIRPTRTVTIDVSL